MLAITKITKITSQNPSIWFSFLKFKIWVKLLNWRTLNEWRSLRRKRSSRLRTWSMTSVKTQVSSTKVRKCPLSPSLFKFRSTRKWHATLRQSIAKLKVMWAMRRVRPLAPQLTKFKKGAQSRQVLNHRIKRNHQNLNFQLSLYRSQCQRRSQKNLKCWSCKRKVAGMVSIVHLVSSKCFPGSSQPSFSSTSSSLQWSS